MGQLLTAYEHLIRELSEKVTQEFHTDFDDAQSAALLELMGLIHDFEPAKKSQESLFSFVSWLLSPLRVYKAIPKRGTGYRDRQEQRTNLTTILERVPDSRESEQVIDVESAAARLRELVNLLPEKPKRVITRRYNLDGQGGATLAELIAELGVNYVGSVSFHEQVGIEMIRRMALKDTVLQEALNLESRDIMALLRDLGGKPIGGKNFPVGSPGKRKF